ncbi:inositol-pentakisphosphate 2-kinase [Mrakia frigida]|uniref:inositol-pentakisphosphate 2-kinase n=1 Tax=Mrakia frigida TaxID=29902 RepID=UPI003FCBEF37
MKTVASTSAQDWLYSSEGGANIVFRYHGPPDPSFNNKILRIAKTSRPDPVPPHLPSDPDQIHPPQDPSTLFRNQVMLPLLTEEFMPGQEPVRLEKDFLEELEARSAGRRAEWRKEAEGGGVDKDSKVGLLVDDLTGEREGEGRVLAVEIKPKWGFFPSPTHLSGSTKYLKTTYCRTCMHRPFKASKISSHSSDSLPGVVSDYCPIDLYSGDGKRVSRALEQLWVGWIDDNGQGNSLRLFVDGKIVDPREPSSLSFLLSPSSPSTLSLPDLYTLFSNLFLPHLATSPVFPRLANLQSSLDPLDIEGLLLLLSPTNNDNLKDIPQPNLDEFANFVRSFNGTSSSTEDWSQRETIIAFLLSAAFKDCSLIFRVPVEEEEEREKKRREVSVKVIDLDPKPVERLKKWAKLDGDIVGFFEGLVKRGEKEGRVVRRCVGE